MLKKLLKLGGLKIWNKSVDNLRTKHPLQILFWECTLKCNFKCRHCGSSANENPLANELTTGEIKKALREVSEDFNPRQINIAVTGGEPLTRPDLFEVMTYAHSLGFNWGMVSNGFLVTEEVVEKMKNSGMNSLVISIDGTEETHDALRGVTGAYQKALQAVRLAAGKGFLQELNITTTINKKNISQLEEMYKLFRKSGINSWRISNIDPIGRAESNLDLLLDAHDLKYLLNFIREKRKKSSLEITYGCSGFLGHEYEGEVRKRFFMCATGITVGSILANGDIYVCPNVPRIKELIQGNVRNDRFGKVWKEKFKFFRDKKRTQCANCASCEHWDDCLGNSLHLWDFQKNQPKMCHSKMLNN